MSRGNWPGRDMSRGNVRIAVLQPRCTACSKSGCPTVEVNDVVVEKRNVCNDTVNRSNYRQRGRGSTICCR